MAATYGSASATPLSAFRLPSTRYDKLRDLLALKSWRGLYLLQWGISHFGTGMPYTTWLLPPISLKSSIHGKYRGDRYDQIIASCFVLSAWTCLL